MPQLPLNSGMMRDYALQQDGHAWRGGERDGVVVVVRALRNRNTRGDLLACACNASCRTECIIDCFTVA